MPKHEEGARVLAPEHESAAAPPKSGVIRRRSVTINPRRMTQGEIAVGRALYPPEEHDASARPRTRGECIDAPRPCPFVSCRHHLYLDVASNGSIVLNFPELEPDQLVATCSLDLAGDDGRTLEEVGEVLHLTRERVRQIETAALAKLRAVEETRELRGLPAPRQRRRLPVV